MYAPVVDYLQLSAYTNYLVAFVIGVGFGYFLEQGGFGNARKLALVFYFRDMTVIKVMFSALVTALLGTVLLSHYNILDFQSVWINPTYLWAGVVGGVIMGILAILGWRSHLHSLK